jgi:hypothetical protein
MGSIGHILGTLAKAIFKIIFVGVICGVIGFAVIYGAAYFGHSAHTISTLDYIVAGVVGVLALYAGGVTVLMVEAVSAARAALVDAEKEAGSAIKGAATVVQQIEKHL